MWGETKEGVKRYCIQPEELLDLLKAIGSDNLGICWDTEHGAIENLDQDKAIAKVGPYSGYPHFRPDRPGKCSCASLYRKYRLGYDFKSSGKGRL